MSSTCAMSAPGSEGAKLLRLMAERLIVLAPSSDKLNQLQWHAEANPIRRDLAIEAFVNGAVLTSEGPQRTVYQSPLVDSALSSVGIHRADLRDLSRTVEIDVKINSAPWAEDFRRERLEATSNFPNSRSCSEAGGASLVDATYIKSRLAMNFPRVQSTREGVLALLKWEHRAGIYGYVRFGDGELPVVLKPYLVVAFDVPFNSVQEKVVRDRRLLHPVWILSQGLGGLLVCRTQSQLRESFETFLECLKALASDPGMADCTARLLKGTE